MWGVWALRRGVAPPVTGVAPPVTGVAPPVTLLALLARGASPRAGPSPSVYNMSVIIYGLVTVTNNYTKIEGPAPGAKPPREQSEQRGWRRNARGWRRNAYA